MWCVHDLRVELDSVQLLPTMLEGGDRRRRRGRRDYRSFGGSGDRVPMAHPDRLLGGRSWKSSESAASRPVFPNSETPVRSTAPRGPAPSAASRNRSRAWARRARRSGGEVGSVVAVHRRRPAGQYERRGVSPSDLVGGQPVADELRVHARFPHAPRDQLAVLAAEIDDEHWTFLALRKTRIRERGFWSREI